jgi:hypothetical protein
MIILVNYYLTILIGNTLKTFIFVITNLSGYSNPISIIFASIVEVKKTPCLQQVVVTAF